MIASSANTEHKANAPTLRGIGYWKVIASQKVIGASRQRAGPRSQSTKHRAGARCNAQRERCF